MAKFMKVGVRPFREKYSEVVEQMKRSMLNYINSLHEAARQQADERQGTDYGPAAKIMLRSDGLPILPHPDTWRSGLKRILENLLREYLGQHYSASAAFVLFLFL